MGACNQMNKRLALAAVAIVSLSATSALAQPPSSPGRATPATPATPATSATPADPGVSSATPATPATRATPATPPADEPADTSASTAPSASTSGTDVVATGMSVKDNTGATIGQISEVKTGPDGKKTATIKMGAETFAVDTASLAISRGAATVNATKDEISKMLKK